MSELDKVSAIRRESGFKNQSRHLESRRQRDNDFMHRVVARRVGMQDSLNAWQMAISQGR